MHCRNRLWHTSFLVLLLSMFVFASCVDEDEYADNPRGNFEALWKAIDEHYCFFDYKREQYGLDWDKIHDKYSAQIADDMTDTQLFEVLGNMLAELRDGHVNMYSSWDVARNWSWHEDYPSNVSDTLLRRYLPSTRRQHGLHSLLFVPEWHRSRQSRRHIVLSCSVQRTDNRFARQFRRSALFCRGACSTLHQQGIACGLYAAQDRKGSCRLLPASGAAS